MRRQIREGRIHQPEQLAAVALKLKPAAQQLQFVPSDHLRMLAKWIGVQVGNNGVILTGHVSSQHAYPAGFTSRLCHNCEMLGTLLSPERRIAGKGALIRNEEAMSA
jgi:hypothetical protein